MCRYGNLDYLFKLPFKKGFDLIIKALEKKQEETIYSTFIDLQAFKSMTYNEYKEKIEAYFNKPIQTTTQEVEDTLKKVENILGGVF